MVGAGCCLLWNPMSMCNAIGIAMVTTTDGGPAEVHEGP